ncbi:MAG: CRISPR-associated endonuclease Cas6, partial [Candidatus Micrarchaeaceae archaeon]
MVELKYSLVSVDLHGAKVSTQQLRGFLGYTFLDDAEFHHHALGLIYRYPKIQYKIIDGKAIIMGFSEYQDKLLQSMKDIRSLILGRQHININSIVIERKHFEIGEKNSSYFFATPWIALNEKNFFIFKQLNKVRRGEELEKILVGNILSALKGLSIRITFRLRANINSFYYKPVYVNNNFFIGFR